MDPLARASLDRYGMLAGYNGWANRLVYEAAAALADAEYREDRGAFFGSLHRTLNHLLVTDRLWIKRLTGQGEAPPSLDTVLYEDLAELRAARVAADARIEAFVAELTPAALEGVFTWTRIADGMAAIQPLWAVLDHLFNHQTHHRGQAHAILTGLRGRDFAPSLDLPLYQRESGLGWGEAL